MKSILDDLHELIIDFVDIVKDYLDFILPF